MTESSKTGFVGLVTNASAEVSPPGSLDVAENVVLRQPGRIEPRPGVRSITLGWSPSGTPKKIWEYDGYLWVWATDGVFRYDSSTERRLVKTDNTTVDLTAFREDLITTAQARENCYVATQTGVLKLTGAADTAFTEAGAVHATMTTPALTSAGTPRALATGYKFAYRAVVKRKDANGLVIRSVPSGYASVSNTSGATRDVVVSAYFGLGMYGTLPLSSADEVEIYRTGATLNASAFSEEYSLVATLSVSAGAYFYQTAAFTDTVLDSERGARLYTSPSQGGATAENQRPPACGCVEAYRGHVFFGNTVGPFRKIVSCNVSSTDLTGVSTGIGYRSSGTCNVALGAAVITGMATTTGLQAGMVVYWWNAGAAANVFPQNTYIVSVDSATQVTMSANALYATGPTTAYFMDAVQVGGEWKPVISVGNDAGSATVDAGVPFEVGIGKTSNSTAFSRSLTYFARLVTPPNPPYARTAIIEEFSRSSSSSTSTIRATHGAEYAPAIAVYSGTATDMDRDVFKNGIAWSKLGEPEHVPPVNFAQVGDQSKEILALAATRDNLFILKEDGIWRLSGSGGNGVNAWRIDPFDMTTFCVLPQSVQKLNNKIYFLSQKGLVRLSDSGVELVSSVVNDQMRLIARYSYSEKQSLGYYTLADAIVYHAAGVNPLENEYMLSVPNISGVELDSCVYVFNENTGAFTTWALRNDASGANFGTTYVRALGWSQSLGAPILGTASAQGWIKRLTNGGDSAVFDTNLPARDDGYSAINITGNVASGSNWTTTYTGAYQLLVGDVIVDSNGDQYVVVTQGTSTTAVVSSISGSTSAPAAGAGAYAVATISTKVRCRPFTVPNTRQKLWTNAMVGFGKLVGGSSAKLTCLSTARADDEDSDAETEETFAGLSYVDGFIFAKRGGLYVSAIPRALARAWRLMVGVEVNMSKGTFHLEMIGAESRDDATGKTSNVTTTVGS